MGYCLEFFFGFARGGVVYHTVARSGPGIHRFL